MTTPDRDHALDAARGILMMMGVLLHAANIYSVDSRWLVVDPMQHPAFNALVGWIHFFRMPAFFWISGYFCALTFQRKGVGGLLRQRIPRLVVPLISTWLVLNVAQELWFAWSRGRTVAAELSDGVPLYHLWFLVDLSVFVAVAALVMPLATRLGLWPTSGRDWHWPILMVGLAVMSVLANLAVRASGAAYVSLAGLTTPLSLMNHAPFFAAGIMMYRNARSRARFLSTPVWLALAAPAIGLWLSTRLGHHGIWLDEVNNALQVLLTWIAASAVLRTFYVLFRTESAATRYLSDSAYTVYLFHHLFVVVLGSALLPSALPVGLKYLAVCGVSLMLSAAVHHFIIRRWSVARLLFNGK